MDETIGYREEFLREYGKIWCRGELHTYAFNGIFAISILSYLPYNIVTGWTLSFSMVREALKFENELETKEMSFTRRSANEPKSDFHNLS